jgi:rubredoxin
MEGSGEFGRHHVEPYHVHFARAYTPYGPLVSDKDTGWGFIVLRSRFDPGAQRFPDSLAKLKAVPNRKPWQVTVPVDFPERTGDVSVHDVSEISDEHGLFTHAVTMAPNAKMRTPDRNGGDGQYIVAVKGSLLFEGAERKAPAVIFLDRDEGTFELVAGGEGLDAIVLNFPRADAHEEVKAPEHAPGFKTWQCVLCAFVYDEEAGWPDEGIPPGTRWADVPESWSCPDCSATKRDFKMIEI